MEKTNYKELEYELNQERIAGRELNESTKDKNIIELMKFIEKNRKEKKKSCSKYTQAYITENAGIKRKTYISYVQGYSDDITVKALRNIMKVLNIKTCDISKFFE